VKETTAAVLPLCPMVRGGGGGAIDLGKRLKMVIGVAIGVLVVLFIGVPIVLSFVAPGTVLKAAVPNNNITGVTQFFVLKGDGSLYNVRFSLVNKDSAAVYQATQM
jgi:hypothetical protein